MEKRLFGKLNGKEVFLYTLSNNNFIAEIIEYGCVIRSLKVKNKFGDFVDVVLGYDTLEEYATQGGCLGATIGRFANRIDNACFKIDNTEYKVTANKGNVCCHGGKEGFHKKIWSSKVDGEKLILTYVSEDGEEGFPGKLTTDVTYSLTDKGLKIGYSAISDKDTVINLTNHSYFNLDNGDSVLNTLVYINADKITPSDEFGVPHNAFLSVKGTPFDFTTAKLIGKDINSDYALLRSTNGYDNNYVLNGEGYRLCAVAYSNLSGIEMSVYTDQKGVQFYTANNLSERNGKGGKLYNSKCAFCFETQNFPNAVNCPNYPSAILRKNKKFGSVTEYNFGVK